MLTSFKKYTSFFLVAISLFIGLSNFDKYGIGSDEQIQHQIGVVSYDYIFSNNNELVTYCDRDYGVAFELPLIIVEKTLNLKDSRDIYLTRHLLTHLFFLLCAFFCFLLIDFMYADKLLASIGFLMILLFPLLYSHSYFNTKDVPFAGMFFICFYLNAIAFHKRQGRYFLLLGIGIGLLINLRIMGVLLFSCILFFLVLDLVHDRPKKGRKFPGVKPLVIFITTTLITLYCTWPFLWKSPFSNFVFAFKNMSHFRWFGSVLFNGHVVKASQLDWSYVPVWFTITTPVLYLVIGFSGIILLVITFFRNPISFLSNTKKRNNLFFLICFVAPILAVIVLKPVMYDGWRQMYFIYSSFVLLAVYGLSHLFQTKLKIVSLIVVFLSFGYVSYFMIVNNPFQQVYFNEFTHSKPPEFLRKNYDLDYWGVSYKQSLEYVLKNDSGTSINVAVFNPPGKYNLIILPVECRKRIRIVEISEAKYFITNYRRHPEDYIDLQCKKWHAFKVNNNTINEIFKLK